MRYWWVNQNQTYRHEVEGGYLWSPKRSKGNRLNPFYECMREVAPGDVVFSFCDTQVKAIGIVSGYCRENPKPTEFGTAGTNWSDIGWKVDVRWRELGRPIRPKDHLGQIRHALGYQYAPLTADGNGKQAVYLTTVSRELAALLFQLIGPEANQVREVAEQLGAAERDNPAPERDIEEWEHRVEKQISTDTTISETERDALIRSRRGQGIFRTRVRQVERECRITKVRRAEHLIASHIQPWRRSSNEQRLDGENGLLLTPTIDHLFDKGFISFEDTGKLIVSPVADAVSLQRMGVDRVRIETVGSFSEGQRRYLDFHRNNVLRQAKVRVPSGAG